MELLISVNEGLKEAGRHNKDRREQLQAELAEKDAVIEVLVKHHYYYHSGGVEAVMKQVKEQIGNRFENELN
jgi:hypothetical protein